MITVDGRTCSDTTAQRDNGKGGGWKYMDGLHENMAQYTHSGSKPCNMAAAGEFVVGISFEYRANANKAKGAPIDLVFPKEGLGWDLEAFAITKGTKKLEAAKQLADWSVPRPAPAMYREGSAVGAMPGGEPVEVGAAALACQIVIDDDALALSQKVIGAVAADEPGSAGDENSFVIHSIGKSRDLGIERGKKRRAPGLNSDPVLHTFFV